VSYETNNYPERDNEPLFSKRLKAGKRRTYFFDVRATRGKDYFLTITESKKRFNDDGYDRHKIFLYKEDFNKFIGALTDAVDYVKTELLPDFDFDSFSHEDYENHENHESQDNHEGRDGRENGAHQSVPAAHESKEDVEEPAVAETVSSSAEPVESTDTASDDLDMDVDKW
jgi:hypothetical protein